MCVLRHQSFRAVLKTGSRIGMDLELECQRWICQSKRSRETVIFGMGFCTRSSACLKEVVEEDGIMWEMVISLSK